MLRLDIPRRATINESPQLTRLVLEAEREKGPVELDCSKTEAWGPFGVALITSCFGVRRLSGRTTALVATKDMAAGNAGLDESQLIQLAIGQSDIHDEWLVQSIKTSDDSPLGDLTRQIAQSLVNAKASAPGVVEPCLTALFDNLHRWSESLLGGVIVMRWHKKSHKIKVAFVDRGIGIPAALRRSPASPFHRATDVDIIESAVSDPAVSSRAEGELGQGLKTLRETVLSHRGKLTVISLGAKVTWTVERIAKTTSPALHGTAIEFEILA